MTAQVLESLGTSRVGGRAFVLWFAAALLGTVMILEGLSDLDYSLEVLYAIPVAMAATVFSRWQIVLLAVACAAARSYFTPGPHPVEFWLRFIMAVLAFGGIGILVAEMSRNRRAILEAYSRLSMEESLRRRAEDQLRFLVESSPAAIMTLSHGGKVLAANRAAAEMLGFASAEAMIGINVAAHVPLFAGALRVNSPGGHMKVASTCWASHLDGTRFPASAWFSTYEDRGSRRLAAILVDTSEEVREREYEALRSITDASRLLAGAVAHEIRNMCSAIRVVTSNLGRNPAVSNDVDFGALHTLVESLMRIAAFELSKSKDRVATRVEVTRVLESLRVVIDPDWSEAGGTIVWRTAEILPYVHADEHALLQVFLNVSTNALRSIKTGGLPNLEIEARSEEGQVVISFHDSGPGVEDAGLLFKPFRENANGTGLGLYVSRAMMRGFGGDLRYVPVPQGCRFDVILQTFREAQEKEQSA